MGKLLSHLKYRWTRLKTKLGLLITVLAGCIIYFDGDYKQYLGIAITVLSVLNALYTQKDSRDVDTTKS